LLTNLIQQAMGEHEMGCCYLDFYFFFLFFELGCAADASFLAHCIHHFASVLAVLVRFRRGQAADWRVGEAGVWCTLYE
jgi:hypothetical protein